MEPIESPIEQLQNRLARIEARNARVEADKAWEVSTTRRLFIVSITYLCAALFLLLVGHDEFYLHAAVPPAGYLLSTLTLPELKELWITRRGRN